MEKYFDINESGFSIRCKLYYNKDLHDLPHIVVATYGFGGNKDNKAIEKFAERLTTATASSASTGHATEKTPATS